MSEEQKEQNQRPDQNSENQDNVKQQSGQGEQLSEEDKLAYNTILSSISRIDKKVKNAKTKLSQENEKGDSKATFKQIAQKLIESKQNSDITNKEDLQSDVSQSFERAVVDIYSQNQKLKRKVEAMEKLIHEQNHKLFQHEEKEQKMKKEVEDLRLQLAEFKDNRTMATRVPKKENLDKSGVKEPAKKYEKNDNQGEDFDFWNTPHDQVGYGKKKKEYIQNSGLWVNQQQNGSDVFVTEGRR